jgi:hypothetical protein
MLAISRLLLSATNTVKAWLPVCAEHLLLNMLSKGTVHCSVAPTSGGLQGAILTQHQCCGQDPKILSANACKQLCRIPHGTVHSVHSA